MPDHSHSLEKARRIAREEASPVVDKLLGLLLRAGVYGLLEFQERELARELEAPSWEARRAAPVERVNPEGLRTALRRCGVLLAPSEHRLLLRAFSDAVGFVRAGDLVAALSPLRRLPAAAAARVEAALRVDGPAVSRGSLTGAFLPALLGSGPEAEVLEAEAARCFSAANFPTGGVPPRALRAYLGGLLWTAGEGAAGLLARLDAIAGGPPLLRAWTGGEKEEKERPANPLPPSPAPGFEPYDERDRLDEWRRAREARGPRRGYLEHVVGYAGHLPSFKTHFGRTFHVIEEDLPRLTRPRSPRPPLPLDAYGPAIALKHNRMCEHHFKFS